MKRVIRCNESSSIDSNLSDILDNLNSLPVRRGISKVSLDDIESYQSVLMQIPVGTTLEHRTDAGHESFTKTRGGEFGWWSHFRAPWKDVIRASEFNVARWLAGRGVISRSDITLASSNNKVIEASVDWNSLSGSEQSAAEYAIDKIQRCGWSIGEAVSEGCSMYSYGNAESEYEDEDFYEDEPRRNVVYSYVEDYIDNNQ